MKAFLEEEHGRRRRVVESRARSSIGPTSVKAPDPDDTVAVASSSQPRPAQREQRSVGGRYMLLARIGAGGMGEVFKAYDPVLGRLVAIKRVFAAPTQGIDEHPLRREAQAIALLSHPNVIAVFDVGTEDDKLYMAMELVEGLPLGKWLERRKPKREAILDVFLQAARGLAAAHEAGLVHRDFKPSNVLIGDDGRVRVLDFGIARRLEHNVKPRKEAAPFEEERSFAGTPRYMAPEQFLGRDVDGRADQFAFCAALYEALTEHRPFDSSEGIVGLAQNVVAGRVQPVPEQLGLPSWLTELVLRGLRVDPSSRASSMHDVIAELERDRQGLRRTSLDGSSTDDLLAAFPPPDDPPTAARVLEVRERLEQAAELKRRGDFSGALEIAEVVLRQAAEVDYAPLQAAAAYTLGNLQHRTGDSASARATLYRSAELAAFAGDDWQVANVWVFLVRVVGHGLRRFEEAEALAQVAAVAIARLGDNASLRSRLANAKGRNLRDQGRTQEALRCHELALAIDEDTHGPDHPLVVVTLAHVAEALLEIERTSAARRHLRRALSICRAHERLGPTYATCLSLYGRALFGAGDIDESESALQSAREIFLRYADRRVDLGEVLSDLARCRLAREDASAAEAFARMALDAHLAGTFDPVRQARAQLVLAYAIDSAGGPSERRDALVAAARAACDDLGAAGAMTFARLDAWADPATTPRPRR